ncbi:MAG: ABC transporter ATP-binding protein [Burkholderiales bacterium]|jgi:lipopolysaccharide transport system ATP-binding protein|nr:ABC transporter ATP-binding protein [Burkholderiales bacterium]
MSAEKPLLRLSGVGKDYAKVHTAGGRLRLVWRLLRRRRAADIFCALDDIGFTLQRGQSLGIIGENGAGKSTLLKIIAGVVKPTRGLLEMNGRIGALLELGSGFHPEYTGLANIELAATLFGLDAEAIRGKRDDIIAFADLGEHINDPIKTYSSGMVVRLGFAVATALSPEILITDEVLAVGDESFQKKCVAWMEKYLENGGTLLLCSHSMYHIQKLCASALWLKNGKMEQYGSAFDVTQAYLAYHERRSASVARVPLVEAGGESGFYTLMDVEMQPETAIRMGDDFSVRGKIYSPDGREPVMLFGLTRQDGTPVYGVSTDMDKIRLRKEDAKRFAFDLVFPNMMLLPGQYLARFHALDPEGVRLFDTIEMPLTIKGETREFGLARLPHEWRHQRGA